MNDDATDKFDESCNFDSQNSTIDFALNSYNYGSRSNSSSEFGEEFFETYSPETKSLKDLYKSLDDFFYHDCDSSVPQNIYDEVSQWKKRLVHLRPETNRLETVEVIEKGGVKKSEEIYVHNDNITLDNPLLNSSSEMHKKSKRLYDLLEKKLSNSHPTECPSLNDERFDIDIARKLKNFLTISTSKHLFLRSQQQGWLHSNEFNESTAERKKIVDKSSRQTINDENKLIIKPSNRHEDNQKRIASSTKRSNLNQVKTNRNLETIQEVGTNTKKSPYVRKAVFHSNVNGHPKVKGSTNDKTFNNAKNLKTPRRPPSTASTSSYSTTDGNPSRPISRISYSPSRSLVHLMLVNQNNSGKSNKNDSPNNLLPSVNTQITIGSKIPKNAR